MVRLNLWSDKAYYNNVGKCWTYEVHFVGNLVYFDHFNTDAPEGQAYQDTLKQGRYNFGMKLFRILKD